MYFNLGIRQVDCKTNHNKYMYMYFNSTGSMCKNVLLSSYLLQCIPLHYYALLLFVEPRPDHIKLAHNSGSELFVNLVTVSTQAGHIGGTAPVRELLINKYFSTGMLFLYLSLNGNEISSVIRPAKLDQHNFTYMYIPLLVCRWAARHLGPLL